MEPYILGIDFGTCNIKVSQYIEQRGEAVPLKIDKDTGTSDYILPNIILYKGRDQYNIGSQARKEAAYSNGSSAVSCIKRKLEYKEWSHDFTELGFTLTAEEIANDSMLSLRRKIEDLGREIGAAAITVPVCFTEVQKEKIYAAAKNAGIPVDAVISEPVAALFAIEELFEEECEENVVVFDFGGSTLDICLCHVENDGDGEIEMEVAASCGVRFGGVDITQALYEKVIEPRCRELITAELAEDRLNRVTAALLETTDEMKIQLFSEDEEDSTEGFYISPIDKKPHKFCLNLDEANAVLESTGIRERILNALDDLFEDTDYTREEVTMVKTSGGTSRIPFFRRLLEEYFHEDAFERDDYDHDTVYAAVADGAARYLSVLRSSETGVHLHNSVPYYIGMDNRGVFRELLPRNKRWGRTPYKPIAAEVLDLSNWTISLYQTFSRENTELDGDGGAVYMGSIQLDKALYGDAETILCKMGVQLDGTVFADFSVTDEESMPVLVETKKIVIGGTDHDGNG